jgi:peptidoglycan/xylan/chitin deacetylase (PgdA/CDA1 family)
LADTFNVNIGLAVIPGRIEHEFVHALLAADRAFFPMCHGWNHTNYGRPGEPEEFGHGRPFDAIRSDAEQAYKVFAGYFGADNAIFVPPFGRITSALLQELSHIGFAGVSTGPRFLERTLLRLNLRLEWTPVVKIPRRTTIPRFDVQIDVIDWKRRTARNSASIAAELVANLGLRRRGFLPFDHPVGLLTHHLAHDEPIWRLCNELLEALRRHDAVEPLNANDLLRLVPERALLDKSRCSIRSVDASSRLG